MGDKWTTSGRSRLKAIQKKSFSHRAHQQRQNRSSSTANTSMENNAMPPSFRTNDSLNTEDCHPRLRKRQASFAGTYSSHADPIARRGVWVSMGPAPGEYNANHPPVVMQQIYNSRRIRDSSKFQSNVNNANNEGNKYGMMQNYRHGNVPIPHHANTTIPKHTQQYNHRPVSGPYLHTLPRGEHEYTDPLAYSAQAQMSNIAPIPFDDEETQYFPQDFSYASEEREMLLPINSNTNFSPTSTHKRSMARRVSGHYFDDRQNPVLGLPVDDSYTYEQPRRRSGMMATRNNITPGNFSRRSFEDAWKTDRIQYQTKGSSRSFEEAFGIQTSNQNVTVGKGISRFQKSNKIPKFDSFSVDAEIGTDDTDWGFDHQQDSSFYDDVLLPVYSTVSNDESINTKEVSSCNLGEGLRQSNSATEWGTSQGFDFNANQQDFRGVDRRHCSNHGIPFFQRRQSQSIPLHTYEEDCAVTNDGMVNETQYDQNDFASVDDLLFGVHPSYDVDPVSFSSPRKHPDSNDPNFAEFELPSLKRTQKSLQVRTEFESFQPQASSTISKSQFVSMHVSRQPGTENAPSSIIKQSFYQNESFDDCKGNIAFDEHFLARENGSTDFPQHDYSKANRYSIRYVTEAIEVDIKKGSFFSPSSGTRCNDENYGSTGIPAMQQGQARHFTTKTREQHEAMGHTGVNADLDDEIDLQGMQSLWEK